MIGYTRPVPVVGDGGCGRRDGRRRLVVQRRPVPAIHRAPDTAARFSAVFGSAHVTYGSALAAGFSREQLRTAVRRGHLVRPRHGFLAIALPSAAADTYGSEQERVSHLIELRHACAALHGPLVASYDSAALLHRLPRPSTRPAQLSLTRPGASPDHSGALVLRGSGIPDEQRTHIDGFAVTTIERTAIDLARGRRLADALFPLMRRAGSCSSRRREPPETTSVGLRSYPSSARSSATASPARFWRASAGRAPSSYAIRSRSSTLRPSRRSSHAVAVG